MKKNVYSLVLSAEVVEAIDLMAYKRGTSRSNLINRILADHAGFVTDQKRMEDLHAHCSALLEQYPRYSVSLKSDVVLTIRAPLSYKYNPTLVFSITVLRKNDGLKGELRASLRSQSRELIFHLKRFFLLWSKIEQAYGQNPALEIAGDKFRRLFDTPERMEADHKRQAEMIACYVTAMTSAFGEYFRLMSDMMEAVKGIEQVYLAYLKESRDIM